jgi:dTDP-4-amino-4,6-dideoxygalactose transaminase
MYRAIDDIVKSNKFIMGEAVGLFEKEFADFCKTKYCVGTGNGTLSLHVALVALGIGTGDEVITVPNTFIATSEAITQTGARAVFCDINRLTHTLDPESFEKKITKKTKAVIAVHIHGNPCEMDKINKIAKKYNLFVVEDAAQAHGAVYKNKRIGNWSDVAAFSFFPAKNLGAWGDAGGVVTNNRILYEKMKMLVNHGRREKYLHDIEGFNYRLDTIQAAILRIKLPYLESWNTKRRENATFYRELFTTLPEIECSQETQNAKSVYHLFSICHSKRDVIKKYLASYGIETGIHYPVPLHLQPAYGYLKYKEGDLPVAEEKARTILSLPMYPELTKNQIRKIVSYVKEAISQ